MESFFDFFNQGWVGSVIGLIGILIALVTYKKSKVGAKLVCDINSSRIISKSITAPDEITIHYKGNEVTRVIKTKIKLWNSGTKTIYGSNIVDNDPLRVEVDSHEEIIGFNVLKTTKDSNDFNVELNEPHNVKINFNFLDANDGAVFEILHTDKDLYPTIKGTIIGMPKGAIQQKGIDYSDAPTSVKKLLYSNFPMFFSLIFGILMLLPFFISRIPEYKTKMDKLVTVSSNMTYIVFFIVGLIYTAASLFILITSRRKYPKALNIDTK